MDTTTIDILQECASGSLSGSITFPKVIEKLMDCGVESYHTDLYRLEVTYYLLDGDSHVEKMATNYVPVGQTFDAQTVAATIKESQQGQITYRTFLDKILAAGTTHYNVYLVGKRAVYVGRDGSEHVERFPGTN